MFKEKKEISGWKFLEIWQFYISTIIVTALALTANYLDSKRFTWTQVIVIVLPILVVLILMWCTSLYIKYSKELRSCIRDLELLRAIIKDRKLCNAIDEREWLIHGEEVQNKEASVAVVENWTLTPNFHYEVADFQGAVIENLRRNLAPNGPKTKYEYIYPDIEKTRQCLDEFRQSILKNLIKALPPHSKQYDLLILNKYVKIFPIKENIVPLTEGIHNPKEKASKVGLLMTPEDNFPYYIKLNHRQTDALIIKFRQLKELSKKEQDYKEVLFLTEKIIDEYLMD